MLPLISISSVSISSSKETPLNKDKKAVLLSEISTSTGSYPLFSITKTREFENIKNNFKSISLTLIPISLLFIRSVLILLVLII